ncbi:MAG: T9SS type A sorting domain-containing protein [Bacteroidota bacterium]
MKLYTLLICFFLTTIASAQKLIYHEAPDDPYLPIPKSERQTSPAFNYKNALITTVQVNTDENGNNILNDAANEPSIAIDPTDPNRIAIGWRQFDNVESNFRQAGNAFSEDGGATWNNLIPIEAGIFRSDPVLDTDSEGNFYYNSLGVEYGFSCDVFKTADPTNWNIKTFAQGGDKQWMAIDKTQTESDGNIYEVWNATFSICEGEFTRSVDDGNSYEDCSFLSDRLRWGTIAVNGEGTVYTIGVDNNFSDDILLTYSENAKLRSETPIWQDGIKVPFDGDVPFAEGPNPQGLLGQFWVATDNGSDLYEGYVYALGTMRATGTRDPADIQFLRSLDGGDTWSIVTTVNDDATNGWQWFGTMSVAPNGRIDVVWLDTREAPTTFMSALYYSASFDGGESWTPNTRLSESFDPHLGWPNQNKMGDYYDMVSTDEGAHLAWAATFNGEQDVYYSFISAEVDTPTEEVLVAQNTVTVFPNPTENLLHIRTESALGRPYEVELTDLSGQVRLSTTFRNNVQQIAVSQLPKGMYFLSLYYEGERVAVQKVIVQ